MSVIGSVTPAGDLHRDQDVLERGHGPIGSHPTHLVPTGATTVSYGRNSVTNGTFHDNGHYVGPWIKMLETACGK